MKTLNSGVLVEVWRVRRDQGMWYFLVSNVKKVETLSLIKIDLFQCWCMHYVSLRPSMSSAWRAYDLKLFLFHIKFKHCWTFKSTLMTLTTSLITNLLSFTLWTQIIQWKQQQYNHDADCKETSPKMQPQMQIPLHQKWLVSRCSHYQLNRGCPWS